MKFRLLLGIAVLLAQPAHASGYSKFFTPNPNFPPEVLEARRVHPAPERPELMKSADSPEVIVALMRRRGYEAIGHSQYTSGWGAPSDKKALNQGQEIKADLVVVVDPKFSSSVQGAMPITTPNNQTTYFQGTATTYGSGGVARTVGSGTATTYGTQTTTIPYTVNRYEYGAIYFVKMKTRLGVFIRPMEDSERRALETNSALIVDVVVDESPAFVSDILPGDALLSIDGVPLRNEDVFRQLLQSKAGTEVEIALSRSGRDVRKVVRLGN